VGPSTTCVVTWCFQGRYQSTHAQMYGRDQYLFRQIDHNENNTSQFLLLVLCHSRMYETATRVRGWPISSGVCSSYTSMYTVYQKKLGNVTRLGYKEYHRAREESKLCKDAMTICRGADKSLAFPVSPTFILIMYVCMYIQGWAKDWPLHRDL
jgi:hypothetical protein